MTIKRIPFTSFDKILHEYAENGHPLIIEGALQNAGLFNWTPDLLRRRCGNNPISIYFSKTGNFKIDSEVLYTTFGEYIDNKLGDKRYNIQQAPIKDVFPELVSDIPIQNFLEQDYVYNSYMWVSGVKNNTTPLHFDKYNNFFIQCYGEKKFALYDSQQTDYLYPYEAIDDAHVSQVDIVNPDFGLFPLFEKAKPIEVTVYPGEVLFIPTGVWHQVTGLSTSISLNIWFDPFDYQATLPAYTRMFSTEYTHLIGEMSSLVPYKYSDPLSFCGQFTDKGLYFESCISHIALLEYLLNERVATTQFAGGNLENSIKLCQQIPSGTIDQNTVDEVVKVFEFGQELLKHKRLNCTDDQAISVCNSVRSLITQLTALP